MSGINQFISWRKAKKLKGDCKNKVRQVVDRIGNVEMSVQDGEPEYDEWGWMCETDKLLAAFKQCGFGCN